MNKESKYKIGCVQAGADFFNLEGKQIPVGYLTELEESLLNYLYEK